MNSQSSKSKTSSTSEGGVSGGIYGLAFIGALLYYLIHATTFWEGLFGVVKAFVWPAFLIYRLFEFLGM